MPKWLAADGLLKSGIKLIGSKCGQAADSPRKRAYALYPKNVQLYCEPFMGAMNLFVGHPAYPREWAGDTNPYVVNYFQQVQQNPEPLWQAIQSRLAADMTPERFAMLKDETVTCPIEQAAWFYTISRFARNGIVRFNKSGICNSSYGNEPRGRGIMDRQYFDNVRDRIKDIEIFQCDYKTLIYRVINDGAYPSEKFVVLDSPYDSTDSTPGTFKNYWNASFTREDQKDMADLFYKLRQYGIKCLVTINDTDFIREWLRAGFGRWRCP